MQSIFFKVDLDHYNSNLAINYLYISWRARQ